MNRDSTTNTTNHMDENPIFWETHRQTTMGRYLFHHEMSFIQRHLPRAPRHGKFLDLCCGSGHITLPVHQTGHKTIGIDIDSNSLKTIHQKDHTVPLIVADALELPFADESLVGIIAIQALYYVKLDSFLQECKRILSKGGLLIFDCVNRHSYKWAMKRFIGRTPNLHTRDASYTEIRTALSHHNFTIQEIRGYNWIPFTRKSNHPLLPAAAFLEQLLPLHRFPALSPKILAAVTKGE